MNNQHTPEHTPLPWRVLGVDKHEIHAAQGSIICQFYDKAGNFLDHHQNSAFINDAVNNHYRLLKENESMKAEVERLKGQKYFIDQVFADNGEHSHYTLIESGTGIKVWSECQEECQAIGHPVNEDFDLLVSRLLHAESRERISLLVSQYISSLKAENERLKADYNDAGYQAGVTIKELSDELSSLKAINKEMVEALRECKDVLEWHLNKSQPQDKVDQGDFFNMTANAILKAESNTLSLNRTQQQINDPLQKIKTR